MQNFTLDSITELESLTGFEISLTEPGTLAERRSGIAFTDNGGIFFGTNFEGLKPSIEVLVKQSCV